MVAQGIIDAVAAGRGSAAPDGQVGVWLDTPAIDRENGAGFTDRLAYVTIATSRQGSTSPGSVCSSIPCCTTATGLAIDERAATTLPGLFAAGEIAGGVRSTA